MRPEAPTESLTKSLSIADIILIVDAKKRFEEIFVQAQKKDGFALSLIWDSHALNEALLGEEVRKGLKKRTFGSGLVDLGAGDGIDLKTVDFFGFSPYLAVDLRAKRFPQPRRRFIRGEALEFLINLPDGYANVMANGFLCEEWYGEPHNAYVFRVLEEIRRVLPKSGIFIATRFDFSEIACRNGLVPIRDLTRGPIRVFEKASPSPK